MNVLFSLLVFLSFLPGPKQIDSVKLLAVGPEFGEDAVTFYLDGLTESAGKTLEITYCNTLEEASGSWDAVLLSQTDSANVAALAAKAKASFGRKTKVLLYQTNMFTSKKLSKKTDGIVPVDCAFRNLNSFTADSTAAVDNGRVSTLGCYTAACVLFETLFNCKVFGSRYSAMLDSEDRRAAQLSADAAVRKPFKIKL